MQTYNITGKVVEIGDTQTFDSGFTKRTVIVDTATDGKFPCPVPVTFKKDKTSALDSVSVGSEVKIDITIDGRKWDGPNGTKYFVDLTGWSVMTVGAAAPAPAKQTLTEATLQAALHAFTMKGGAKADFALFCERVTGKKPDRALGCDYWAKVIAAACKPTASAEPQPSDDEDLPF